MPVPTVITDLSQTAGSNFPLGSDAPSSLDDTQRAVSSFVALLRDGKGHTNPAALASAATTDIGAQNSMFVEITGTTGITSLGATYNGPRILRFTASLVLTHSASLNLYNQANRTTIAGDMAIAVPNQGLTGWNLSFLSSNRIEGITASTGGGAVNVIGGASTGSSGGGSVIVTGGAAGPTSGPGGSVAVTGGAAGGTTGGAGGAVSVTGGPNSGVAVVAGAATLAGGASTTAGQAGGQANVLGGSSNNTGAGGLVAITGGTSNSGQSGGVTISTTTGSTVGAINITGGGTPSTTAAAGGSITLTGGQGANSTANGSGGAINIFGGSAGVNSTGTGVGGTITITGGNGGTLNAVQTPGSVLVNGGVAQVAGQSGGAVTIASAAGFASGTNASGGDVTITAGAGQVTGNNGRIILNTTGSAGGTAANIDLNFSSLGALNFATNGVAANGAVATAMSSVGPTGASTTIVGWLRVRVAGTFRYVPYW